MSGKRSDRVQQGPPPTGLTGFPVVSDLPAQWHREHADRPGNADHGCWWFSCHKPGVEPEGRFDLLTPNGTCYLGDTVGVAARERVGRFLATHMPIPESHMQGRVVSTVALSSQPDPVANLTAPDGARFGVTGELAGGNDYALSSEWAQALFEAGYGAAFYVPRYTPGQEHALALFGQVIVPGAASVPPGTVSATVPLIEVVADLGYKVSRSTLPSTPAMAADDDIEPEDA